MEPRLPEPLTGASPVPALIVSVFGAPSEIPAQLAEAREAGADCIEWRADLSDDWDACAEQFEGIELPVIATIRTDREGGKFPGHGHDYAAAAMRLARPPFAAIDVEVGRSAAYQVVPMAHDAGIPVIASHHDFTSTPRNDDILATLNDMAEIEADLLKIAYMPKHSDDTWRQMELTREAKGRFGLPVISISMGQEAAWTRVAAKACGSVATFGALGGGSAPGQLDAHLLRRVIDALGR
ncbi:MAG: type I 3-dehydroquinate dehydratase [Flaviflexus sp.]|uniref:type I 3-dehydroquinate dehydratase n=1 Tax=Flaviflexus sp. TaxID=1969482 RepID=UPI003F922E7A